MCVLLVNMEVSIIGTSLVAITDDLHSFDRASWVVTGYLITYCGMLIIWAKLSEIFGRKWVLITSTVFFTVFSGACGAAQTMNQLIAFRVFQGAGAAGSLAIALAICYEIVPPEKYQLQAVQYTSAIALGSLIGPLIVCCHFPEFQVSRRGIGRYDSRSRGRREAPTTSRTTAPLQACW